MAASPASDEVTAGCEYKGPTSHAVGGSPLRAIVLVLMAAAAVAVPIFLLVRFQGHPMSQVWIMSVSISSYVFFFLLCIWRSRWFFTEFARLTYAPLLAFFSASVIGSTAAVFVLVFSMAWAAGNLGYSLAVHRLVKGTELAIHALPSPSFPANDSVKNLNFNLVIVAPFAVLLWTLVMGLMASFVVYAETLTDELDILFFLSYFGWIHAAVWVLFFLDGVPVQVQEVLVGRELMPRLLLALVPWMVISPGISFVSHVLMVLCQLLLMLALVAFLWYNLAIYIHYLEIATLSTTTRENEDTLQSEIQQEVGQVKSDPTNTN